MEPKKQLLLMKYPLNTDDLAESVSPIVAIHNLQLKNTVMCKILISNSVKFFLTLMLILSRI